MDAKITSFGNRNVDEKSIFIRVPRKLYSMALPLPTKLWIEKKLFDDEIKNEPGTLNNQNVRENTVAAIINEFTPENIIETGTYKGAGAKFFSQFVNVDVHTVEQNKHYYKYAKDRLDGISNITCHLGGSEDFLEQLNVDSKAPFVYLDAHGEKDLPLKNEIVTVFSKWPDAIILIDDFKVPHDNGYGYDVYEETSLEQSYLDKIQHEFTVFYPIISSSEETGAKQGSCFLASTEKSVDILNSISSIKEYRTSSIPLN